MCVDVGVSIHAYVQYQWFEVFVVRFVVCSPIWIMIQFYFGFFVSQHNIRVWKTNVQKRIYNSGIMSEVLQTELNKSIKIDVEKIKLICLFLIRKFIELNTTINRKPTLYTFNLKNREKERKSISCYWQNYRIHTIKYIEKINVALKWKRLSELQFF